MFFSSLLSAFAVFASVGNVQSLPICNIANLRDMATSPSWSLAYLNLADFTYFSTSQAKINAVQALPPLPTPDCNMVGDASWKVVWGPSDQADANLMMIVEYSVGGQPVFIAPVIRGTDATSEDVLSQIVQDLDAANLVPWTNIYNVYPLTGGTGLCGTKNGDTDLNATNVPSIARGTCKGLVSLMSLTVGGKTVADFMKQYTMANTQVPVIVTGHSLGGCQTTAVTYWLSGYLKPFNSKLVIGGFPFAPSTAGNRAWANDWSNAFGENSKLWLNDKDVVPYGYDDVAATANLWVPTVPAPPAKSTLGAAIIAMTGVTIGKDYTQPLPNVWLKGYIVSTATNFTSQEIAQHYPDMYYRLICQQAVLGGPENVLDYPFPGTPTSPKYDNCAQGVAAIELPGQIKSTTKVVPKSTTTKNVSSTKKVSSTKAVVKTTTTKAVVKTTTTKAVVTSTKKASSTKVATTTTTTTKRKP